MTNTQLGGYCHWWVRAGRALGTALLLPAPQPGKEGVKQSIILAASFFFCNRIKDASLQCSCCCSTFYTTTLALSINLKEKGLHFTKNIFSKCSILTHSDFQNWDLKSSRIIWLIVKNAKLRQESHLSVCLVNRKPGYWSPWLQLPPTYLPWHLGLYHLVWKIPRIITSFHFICSSVQHKMRHHARC